MKFEIKILVFSYLILIVVMFVLPFFTAEGYSIVENTTSQLGAQKTPNSWIMNITFALLGVSSIYAGWLHYKGYWFQKILLLIFGCSLILTAIYSHAPIDVNLEFNKTEDSLHSLFASITGFSFSFLAISTGFIKEKRSEIILPIFIGMLATILSILMFTVESLMGVWQRLIFLFSFGWLIFEFNRE